MPVSRALYGIDGVLPCVSAVDGKQRGIVGGFRSVFHQYERLFRQCFQIVEQAVGHAVGACADDDAYDIGHSQCLFVHGCQPWQFGVGVRICLEIRKIFHLRIFPCKKLLSFFQLLRDGQFRLAVVGVESLVVAVGAASGTFQSVAVGAGEARIDGYFLNLHGEMLFQKFSEVVVGFLFFHRLKNGWNG